MKTRDIVCIECPNGCELHAEYEEGKPDSIKVEGAMCPHGIEYAKREIFHPSRVITTSIFVEDGEIPLVSVKTDKPIPKEKMFEVIEEIKKTKVQAPVKIHDVLIKDVASTGANVVATKSINRRS